MEIAISVAVKIAAYTVGPIVRPIVRPFRPLWEYDKSLTRLKEEMSKLETKSDDLRRAINDGVEPPVEVKAWLDKVTHFSNEISRLSPNPNRQNMKCCNVVGCYKHRKSVAKMLKVVVQTYGEVTDSKNPWEYRINIQNLKKVVEDLKGRRESVLNSVKEGEEPLPHVQVWLDKVSNIIQVASGLVDPLQQNFQCCEKFICSECFQRRDNVARTVRYVADLLQEAEDFREVSRITEVTMYRTSLQNLKKQVEALKFKEGDVKLRINVGEEPLPSVKIWLANVGKMTDKLSTVTGEYNVEEDDKVVKMLKEVRGLLQEVAEFKVVSYRPPPKLINFQSTATQETWESRQCIIEEIIQKLKNPDFNTLGIFGMGGVGKTTLAQRVGDQVMQDKVFDKVIFAEVSQSPDIKIIQDTIADWLNLKFKELSIPGRARKLHDELRKQGEGHNKILIILDNVWKGIRLQDIGIPTGKDCEQIKLLLTARSHDVLRNEMESEYDFRLKELNDKEAWILFRNIAGTCVEHPSLKSMAEEIAKKCGGMPLAIVTVAKALKDKSSQIVWKDALARLKNPCSGSLESITTIKVYTSVKLSYDYLPQNLKVIFLLCSSMGNTHKAFLEDLLRYGLGLGMFDGLQSVEDALSSLYTSIMQLKAVSLLLDAPVAAHEKYALHDSFALHDIICAIARSIASESYIFSGPDDHVPRSLSCKNTMANYTSITLHNIGELSAEWKCPNLKFLYVKPKYSWLKVHAEFFNGMSGLQVLHLIKMDLTDQPVSLGLLINLQSFCLDYCRLEDLTLIGEMKKLEILSFRGSDIKKLPVEMWQLTDLKLLDLRDCRKLASIPWKNLSSLVGIEALYMNYASIRLITDDSIDGLKHLSRLVILEMHIPNMKMCRSMILSNLRRYKISIGQSYLYDRESNLLSRRIRLDYEPEEDWIISQCDKVEALELKCRKEGATCLLEDLNGSGFSQLMDLHVHDSNHALCILNSESSAVLPALEFLAVSSMDGMEMICNNSFAANSFLHLKSIHIQNCAKLSYIFHFLSFVGVLPNLADLKVFSCKSMKEIFSIENQNDNGVVGDVKLHNLSNLILKDLPVLGGLCSKAKKMISSELQSESGTSCTGELSYPLSLFDEIEIPELKTLQVCGIHNVEKIWLTLHQASSSVLNLTDMTLDNCVNLTELFQAPMESNAIVFPKLMCIRMKALKKLRGFCSGCYIKLPLLEQLVMEDCPEMTFIFDDKVELLNLKSLKVANCEKLQTLFPSNMRERLFNNSEEYVVTSMIEELVVSKCTNLKYMFNPKEGAVVPDEAFVKFVFPKLKTIVLGPELRSFHPT